MTSKHTTYKTRGMNTLMFSTLCTYLHIHFEEPLEVHVPVSGRKSSVGWYFFHYTLKHFFFIIYLILVWTCNYFTTYLLLHFIHVVFHSFITLVSVYCVCGCLYFLYCVRYVCWVTLKCDFFTSDIIFFYITLYCVDVSYLTYTTVLTRNSKAMSKKNNDCTLCTAQKHNKVVRSNSQPKTNSM